MMNWELCIFCGGGVDLRCPADSHQKNDLEVYSSSMYQNTLILIAFPVVETMQKLVKLAG